MVAAYMSYPTMTTIIEKVRTLMTKKRDVFDEIELAESGKLILSGLLDAERTRTSECIHQRNWRDDVSIEEAIEMGRIISKVRNKE